MVRIRPGVRQNLSAGRRTSFCGCCPVSVRVVFSFVHSELTKNRIKSIGDPYVNNVKRNHNVTPHNTYLYIKTYIKGQGWEGESSYAETFPNFGMTMRRRETNKTPRGYQFKILKQTINFVLKRYFVNDLTFMEFLY